MRATQRLSCSAGAVGTASSWMMGILGRHLSSPIRKNLSVRLDRFVSQAAGVSRRQARILIQRGRIAVDGDTVWTLPRHVAPGEQVACAGELLALPQPVYLMLNKPCGLLSATTDSHQTTVMTRYPKHSAARVHPVGRLDKETSGLLLLSDDGAWSHRVTSPNHRCSKTYLAALAEPLAADAEQRLRQGPDVAQRKVGDAPCGIDAPGRLMCD